MSELQKFRLVTELQNAPDKYPGTTGQASENASDQPDLTAPIPSVNTALAQPRDICGRVRSSVLSSTTSCVCPEAQS